MTHGEYLEGIKKSFYFWLDEDGSIGILPEDIEWLIVQAGKNHATSIQNTKLAIEFEKLQLENRRYREVLEFYADEGNYEEVGQYMSNINVDSGVRARKALDH